MVNRGSRVAAIGFNMAARLLSVVNAYIPQSGRPVEEREGTFELVAEVKKALEPTRAGTGSRGLQRTHPREKNGRR